MIHYISLKFYPIESNLQRIFFPVRDVPSATRDDVWYCVIAIFIYLNESLRIASLNRPKHHKVFRKLSNYFLCYWIHRKWVLKLVL